MFAGMLRVWNTFDDSYDTSATGPIVRLPFLRKLHAEPSFVCNRRGATGPPDSTFHVWTYLICAFPLYDTRCRQTRYGGHAN